MKQYEIQQRDVFGTGVWWNMSRAAGVEIPAMATLEDACAVYERVIAAASAHGLDVSKYRVVARDVTPWEPVGVTACT